MLSFRKLNRKVIQMRGMILAVENKEGKLQPKDLVGLSFKEVVERIHDCVLFMERNTLEKDPDYVQILPYVTLLDSEGNRYAYQRTNKVGEQRLGGKYSIGFGGHIDLNLNVVEALIREGFKTTPDIVEEIIICAIYRELMEEVDFDNHDDLDVLTPKDFAEAYRGIIFMDDTEVESVHLGLHFEIHIPGVDGVLEEELLFKGPKDKATLVAEYDQYERWSQYIINSL